MILSDNLYSESPSQIDPTSRLNISQFYKLLFFKG